MLSLFLDQSFGESVLALLVDGVALDVVHRDLKQSSSPCEVWQEMLKIRSFRREDIAFFTCGVGPGSYTGIRSAAATVKAVSFATSKPIVAVCSLLLYAPNEDGDYRIAADAGMGGAFVQDVSVREGHYTFTPPRRTEIGLLEESGQGRRLVVRSLDWLRKKGVEPSSVLERGPNAQAIAAVAYQEWSLGHLVMAHDVPLYYLRKTQAEIDAEHPRNGGWAEAKSARF